jgi:hypothetical protein
MNNIHYVFNNTNDYSIALGNRIGSAAHKQMSRSTIRRNRRQHLSSDSGDSDTSDGENSNKGESSEYYLFIK